MPILGFRVLSARFHISGWFSALDFPKFGQNDKSVQNSCVSLKISSKILNFKINYSIFPDSESDFEIHKFQKLFEN